MLAFIIVMTVAVAVFWFVLWPLRGDQPAATGIDPRLLADRDRAQLAKDRKLDEIRELRADRAAGKLTTADAAPLERELRNQAAELLHTLDAAEAAIDEAEARLQRTPATEPTPDPADDGTSTPTAHQPADATKPNLEPLR
jgi:hypothetical protein